MKKTFCFISILTLALLVIPPSSLADVSASQNFKISLTIPVVVGINDHLAGQEALGKQAQRPNQEIIEEAYRNDHKILLRSIVVE